MMKIAAFDLGSNIGIAENLTNPEGNALGWVLSGERQSRLAQLQLHLEWFFSQQARQFDVVIYERPFARGLGATRALWGYAGVLEAVALNFQVPTIDMPPKTIKAFATGDGKADKQAMIAAAQIMGYCGENEHEADAWCLLRYAEINAIAATPGSNISRPKRRKETSGGTCIQSA